MRKTLLIICMLFALVFGSPVFAAAVPALPLTESEDDISWEVRGTTLLVTGKGQISDSAAWSALADTVTEVVIGSGITGIGADAFSGFAVLTSVSIPNTVKDVGPYAFDDCGIVRF